MNHRITSIACGFHLFIFLICILFHNYAKADTVIVSNTRIFVNGTPFFIKGMCYNPSYPGKGGGALIFKFLSDDIKEKDFKGYKIIKEFPSFFLIYTQN